jgi:hypothetical protein
LLLEREAAKRLAELARFLRARGAARLAEEFDKLSREEREQYELIALGTSGSELPKLAGWELGWYFGGEGVQDEASPRTPREALAMALAFERRTQSFYNDDAANARADAVRAFAAEMSTDEQRHIARLEALQREGVFPDLESPVAAESIARMRFASRASSVAPGVSKIF